ncbi:hypothetical protein KGF54_000885 [Candida jiufengensis]|uniref:uncharacterized protein n=1 Tax=Candida jiufengensis TaxID=497108 RepID=UPI002225991E|nr:uncharacterized protein KGF54_000885 [Candida jiufengensis]KAI5956410.1 hypothetical protein KGF54_000885 [Candida jiufengensis]
MKFAKTLERSLIDEDIPEEWVEAAIQYKSLKKCINKVVNELKFLGLEQNKLKLLINDKEIDIDDTNTNNPIVAQYTLHKASLNSHDIIPILKIILDFSDDKNITNDNINKICQEVKNKIEGLLNEDNSSSDDNNDEKIIELKEQNDGEIKVVSSREGSLSPPMKASTSPPLDPITSPTSSPEVQQQSQQPQAELTAVPTPLKLNTDENSISIEKRLEKLNIEEPHTKKREINIILNSDSKFFKMLDEELNVLDNLRKTEEDKIIGEITKISENMNLSKMKQADLYKWRELFKIYLDSEVYFKYNELNYKQKNNEQIVSSLNQFMNNVNKSGILTQFKKKSSIVTFNQFISMNFHLLKMLKFQTINTEALRKILKKFDKQTSLGIQNIYPKLISSDHIFVSGKSIAQSICYIIQNSVLKLIPQLDDYSCPICMSIAYKPIRLSCNHLFCVRCLVKMKQQDKMSCPMCRKENAILEADSSNLDLESMELMKKYFPIEVREKLKERDKERYRDLKGNSDDKCVIV